MVRRSFPTRKYPPVAEELVRQRKKSKLLREAMASSLPVAGIVEMLFFESPSRPYSEVANELNLAWVRSAYKQKCIEKPAQAASMNWASHDRRSGGSHSAKRD